jgi:hypothetical protein
MCIVRLFRLSQAIRILHTLLLAATPLVAAACGGEDIVWTDPLTLPAGDANSRLRVDSKGRARLVADTSVSIAPAQDTAACGGSVRTARLDDGSLVAVWWSVRADSSADLLASVTSDGGTSWRPIIRIDTVDVSTVGCDRPPPAIATSAGFVHVAYAMRASEGAGVFYAHSMTAGKTYEPALTILYGDRLTHAAVAADKGTVAVAYEDPSGSRPQIGLAISREWGHIFQDRTRGSTGVGSAANPDVAVADHEIAVSWLVMSAGVIGDGVGGGSVGGSGGATNSDGRATRIVRVGRLP